MWKNSGIVVQLNLNFFIRSEKKVLQAFLLNLLSEQYAAFTMPKISQLKADKEHRNMNQTFYTMHL
jgi:hypothetical protein